MTRADLIKLLVERLRRHRPKSLTVPQTVSVIRRLIARAAAGENGCCLWTGAVNNDHYGKLTIWKSGQRRQLYVHRLAFLLAHEPREPAHWQHISHACDVPPCFHPDHVYKERRVENQRRSAENTNRKKARRHDDMREAA